MVPFPRFPSLCVKFTTGPLERLTAKGISPSCPLEMIGSNPLMPCLPEDSVPLITMSSPLVLHRLRGDHGCDLSSHECVRLSRRNTEADWNQMPDLTGCPPACPRSSTPPSPPPSRSLSLSIFLYSVYILSANDGRLSLFSQTSEGLRTSSFRRLTLFFAHYHSHVVYTAPY